VRVLAALCKNLVCESTPHWVAAPNNVVPSMGLPNISTTGQNSTLLIIDRSGEKRCSLLNGDSDRENTGGLFEID